MDPGKPKKKKDKKKKWKSEEKEKTNKVENITKDDDNNNNNNNNNRNDGDGNKINKKEVTTSSSSSQRPAMNAGTSMVVVDHPFIVDDSDHCETPLNAYQDLEVVLDRLLLGNGRKKKKQRSELIIYDPYYCDGGVKDKLSSMGYTNVINNNRDFYKDISTNSIPEYDVLITNPPYSADHIEKILEYVVSMSSSSASASTSTENNKNKNKNKNKPCFLLLPHFVYTKDYYERTIGRCCNSNNNNNINAFFYFLIPEIRYAYVPPDWVNQRRGSKALAKGKETTAPFPSFWYCHTPSSKSTSSASSASDMWLEETFGMSGQIRSKHKKSKLRYAKISKDIPRDFKGEFDTTKKRPNPKARKRLRQVAAQKRVAGAGAYNVNRAGAAANTNTNTNTNTNSAKKKKRY